MKIFLSRLGQAAFYLFATILIAAAVLVSIAHLLTPLLNQHRSDLENWSSELLQLPITIAQVHADWRGNVPELTLTQVEILDKETHKPVFDMQEIKFGFQLFTSLWKRKLVLQDIVIKGAQLTLIQDASASWTIKELPVQNNTDYSSIGLTKVLAWIFSQPYLALHDIELHFLPSEGEDRNLVIEKVVLINQDADHKIKGSFLLRQALPTEVNAQIEWTGLFTDLDHIKAKAYLSIEGISLAQWLPRENLGLKKWINGWQLHQGLGGVDLWLDWDNKQLQEVQSVFEWYDLEFYSERDKKTFPIEHLSGHVGWKRDGKNQVFAGNNLLINFPEHLWPATTFYLVLAPGPEKSLKQKEIKTKSASLQKTGEQLVKNKKSKTSKTKTNSKAYSIELKEGLALAEAGVKNTFLDQTWQLRELRLGYLNLQDLVPIILANADLAQEWRNTLLDLAPLGKLQNLIIQWQAGLTDISKTALSGTFKELTFNPWRQFPGLARLSGNLEWNGSTGKLDLDSRSLVFSLPSLFSDKLAFDRVRAELSFQHHDDQGWSLKVKGAEITNADIQAKAAIQMIFPSHASPELDLSSDFSITRVKRVSHYLPTQIMDPELVNWLNTAFLSGRLESGKALIQGKLNEFPFDRKEHQGKFEVSGSLKGLDLHYAPQWPLLQQAKGRLIFSGHSMMVDIDSALILDIPIKGASGLIPYLGTDRPQVLTVQAKVNTDLAQGLDFIHQSPLEETIGKDLAAFQLKGPMNLALTLSVPLGDPEKVKVLGKMHLDQDSLTLPKWNISLDQLTGDLQFTEQELSAKQIQSQLWGEPTVLRLSTKAAEVGKPSYVEADLMGKIKVSHVQNTLNLALSKFLSGETAYRAQLKLYKTGSSNNEIYFSSDLQGITVDLPSPFGKPAAVKRNFGLNFIIQQTPDLKVELNYNHLIQANLDIMTEENARVVLIDSPQLRGEVTIPYPFNVKQPIVAQLDRLIVNSGNEKTISVLDPRIIPPLRINAKQFIYGNKNLGQLVLNTVREKHGMIIQNFNLASSDYVFLSKGEWTVSNQTQQSQLQGTIESSRVNKFLARLGFSLRNLIVDKGRAAFDLQWNGAPYSFSLATMSGDFSFALEKGRIINLNEADNNKMDLGRMLSLFSLQTIPRRLSLDFSDLFEQGYSFDFMRGDFSMRQGSAFTQKPAVIEGPVAHVSVSGRIGLLAQNYDLNLSVSPYVTESLPVVAGALTLNPFVGAAAWLVNKMVLSKEVSKVITYNYKVTGSWNAPVWRSVQQK